MAKNIVVCCDGTANQFGKKNTNVVKIYELIEVSPNQPNFYDPGVGTASRAVFAPFRFINNKLSQALGLDLSRNVEDAYLYLMNTYEEGDKIFLFGFSRGAHTVRRLADVLGKLGLLYKGSDNMAPFVLRMYEKDEEPEVVEAFRATYTRDCPVHFLGVWDTVSALSSLLRRPKLDGEIHPQVKHAYHAVAIDEKRVQFPPNLFKKNSSGLREEVWFAGVHCDVGGSYNEIGLSDGALKWMMQKAKAQGLNVNESPKIMPNPLDKIHNSWSGIFWFTPFYFQALIFLTLVMLLQLISAYVGLFFDFHWRPLSAITSFISAYAVAFLAMAIAAIFATRKVRDIPAGANIHMSVKERMDKKNYKPKNLAKAIAAGVNWVN